MAWHAGCSKHSTTAKSSFCTCTAQTAQVGVRRNCPVLSASILAVLFSLLRPLCQWSPALSILSSLFSHMFAISQWYPSLLSLKSASGLRKHSAAYSSNPSQYAFPRQSLEAFLQIPCSISSRFFTLTGLLATSDGQLLQIQSFFVFVASEIPTYICF
ncbi:hypothetical protein BJ878DRAFT_308740 [Calycina marina]|uniref:Uncharacterized protein n=1 Tax=Calycina marina TaxID=1763456 RepID=A0A9P7ZAW6_9HELO|nr:hypothetical protein BJ878DRAFT_308740 [Calycina marina]